MRVILLVHAEGGEEPHKAGKKEGGYPTKNKKRICQKKFPLGLCRGVAPRKFPSVARERNDTP